MKFKLHHLTLILSFLTFNTAYNQDNWLHFDGSNDYVNINSIAPSITVLNEFTIDFWCNLPEQQNQEYAVIFGANASFGDMNRFIIRLAGTGEGNENSIVVNIIDQGTSNLIVGNISVFDNICHHVAFTYSFGQSHLFIDGILQGSLNKLIHFESSDLFSLGQEFDPPSLVSQNLTGSLNEFRLWDIALNLQEINLYKDMSLIGNETNLIELIKFNQGVPNENNVSITALNNSANSNHSGNLVNFSLIGNTSNFIQTNCCDFKANYLNDNGVPFNLSVTKTIANCFDTNGAIMVQIPTNETNYSFLWTDLSLSGVSINNISSGNYNLQISDLNACIFDTVLNLEKDLGITNAQINTIHSTCEKENGTIEIVNVEGGQIPYQYSIDNGLTFYSDFLFDNLQATNYQILIKDYNNCTFNSTSTISTTIAPIANFDFLQDTIFIENPILFVNNSSNGSNLNYSWNSYLGNPIISNEVNPVFDFNGIQSGTYPISLTVENENNCTDSVTHSFILSKKGELVILENSYSTFSDFYFLDGYLFLNFIENKYLNCNLEIYNLLGQKIVSKKIDDKSLKINIKDKSSSEILFFIIRQKDNKILVNNKF